MKTTAPKPFVFVLMPFAEPFHDVYNLGIKVACEKAGTYAERVDDQVYDGTILDRIYNQIATADFIIADMTGRNPNVFYEVGYAHALNKKVILLTQKTEDIPFDLKNYPHIIYPAISALQDELCRRLIWLVSQPRSEQMYFQFPLRFLSDGKPLETVTEIELMRGDKGEVRSCLSIGIDMLNSPERIIATINFRLGLILDTRFDRSYISPSQYSSDSYPSDIFKQPDGKLLHLIQNDFALLPGAMEKLYFRLDAFNDDNRLNIGDVIHMTIRVFTDSGLNDVSLSFTLK